MAINEMALRRFLIEVKKRLERHETLLKQHREREKKMLGVIRQILVINKGTISAMPTDRELLARRAARKKLSKAERPVYDFEFHLPGQGDCGQAETFNPYGKEPHESRQKETRHHTGAERKIHE